MIGKEALELLFFRSLNFTSFESYIILSMVCWHFCKCMWSEGTKRLEGLD